YENDYSFLDRLNLHKNTIVVGGGYFSGGIDSLKDIEKCSLEELEILYQISKFNYENHCNAFIIRYFNGDTGFSSKYIADFFGKKIKYVDLLIYDNVNLQEFVMHNVEVAKNKKFIIGWIETPLKRFVFNGSDKYNKNFISVGRILNSIEFDEIKSKILYLSNRSNSIFDKYPNLIPDRKFYGLA
ncbi:TPA: hypothetical protein R1712_001655, partial [Campylobacter lari]|nr:hypothetical protein [Campylobacter lari]